MPEKRVALTTPISRAHASELGRRIFFISPEITGFSLIEDGEHIGEVVLVSERPFRDARLAEKLNLVIENEVASQRILAPKVVWRSVRRGGDLQGDVFGELVAAGLAGEVGEGQVFLGGPLLELMDHLDEILTAELRRHFDTVEYRYPTLILTRTLEQAGYFRSFPQHLMFVTRLHNDMDVYREFAAGYSRRGQLDASVLNSCGNVDYCLPPTMCFHTFAQHRNRTLPGDGVRVVTAKGKSFRFESRYATTLERLWDFTIREIVFLGSRDAVLAARRTFMAACFSLMDALGLDGRCEVGNDPFFCDSETSERIWSQRMLELKYELRLAISGGATVAVGSFNFHDDFFGSSFDIRRETGGPISSACVGFGLERLVYALLCQHGWDPAGWPAQVASPGVTWRAASTDR